MTTFRVPWTLDNVLMFDLWNGSGNNAPPAGWQLVGYDDSAWRPPIQVYPDPLDINGLRGVPLGPDETAFWPTTRSHSNATVLIRFHVVLPLDATNVRALAFRAPYYTFNSIITFAPVTDQYWNGLEANDVPAVLVPGGDNLVAFALNIGGSATFSHPDGATWAGNPANSLEWVTYVLGYDSGTDLSAPNVANAGVGIGAYSFTALGSAVSGRGRAYAAIIGA